MMPFEFRSPIVRRRESAEVLRRFGLAAYEAEKSMVSLRVEMLIANKGMTRAEAWAQVFAENDGDRV